MSTEQLAAVMARMKLQNDRIREQVRSLLFVLSMHIC